MAEWWVERGIGEIRAVRVAAGRIVEARILLDGVIPAGSVVDALLRCRANDRFAVAVTADGTEILLPARPAATDGASVRVEITREVIPGGEAWKRPLGRVSDQPPRIETPSGTPLPFPTPGPDLLEDAGWSDLLAEAATGEVYFSGGSLRVSPTPAMTLLDVDGTLDRAELMSIGAAEAARAILRHGIGGSIGIDLPTGGGAAARAATAAAIDAVLAGTPFERTAVNGFGFVQIVRPRRHASTFELAADRATFEARALLRRAARAKGAQRLVASPAVAGVLERQRDWLAAIARQVGGGVTLRADPGLAISGAYAEPA